MFQGKIYNCDPYLSLQVKMLYCSINAHQNSPQISCVNYPSENRNGYINYIFYLKFYVKTSSQPTTEKIKHSHNSITSNQFSTKTINGGVTKWVKRHAGRVKLCHKSIHIIFHHRRVKIQKIMVLTLLNFNESKSSLPLKEFSACYSQNSN